MTFSLAYRFFTEELNIPVSSKYQQAFTIEQLDKQFPGFAKVATETGVTETYFLGAVQDQSWLKTNQASLYDITPSVSEELSKSKDADYPALYVFAMVIAEEASPSRTQLAKMVRFSTVPRRVRRWLPYLSTEIFSTSLAWNVPTTLKPVWSVKK